MISLYRTNLIMCYLSYFLVLTGAIEIEETEIGKGTEIEIEIAIGTVDPTGTQYISCWTSSNCTSAILFCQVRIY